MSPNNQTTPSWADNLRINSIGLDDLDLSPPVFDYDAASEATVRVANQPTVSESDVGVDLDSKSDFFSILDHCLIVSFSTWSWLVDPISNTSSKHGFSKSSWARRGSTYHSSRNKHKQRKQNSTSISYTSFTPFLTVVGVHRPRKRLQPTSHKEMKTPSDWTYKDRT